MPESLPAVFTRLVADNVGQYEKSLVIDLGGTTLDVGVTNGAKVALPQPGWRFSCQWTHYPPPK